jgi:formate dehydrogenase accessory protein FdhE
MRNDLAPGTRETFATILGRLKDLRGHPHVSGAYVEFRIELLHAQRAVRRALETAGNHSAEWRGSRAEPAGMPLTPETFVFAKDLLWEVFVATCAAAEEHGQETEDLRRLAAAAAAEPAFLRNLARAAAFGPDQHTLETLARVWDIHAETLLFVGRATAAPFIAEAVAAWRGEEAPNDPTGQPHQCPACGSPPSLARLRRPDGRRLLICSLCGSEWEGVRLGCACCGTQDRAALGVLRVADESPRWLETCDACQGYIKTVDERRLVEGEAIYPVVEEAATLHLDLLAEREGYVRRVPYVLSG